jgi:hypothetical protein
MILIPFFLVLFFTSNSQTEMSVHDLDNLTRAQFSTIVKKEFSAVVNSSGKTTIGRYASADIKDGQLAFNATWNGSNGNVFSLNANGGTNDGFFGVFSNSKINSNVGIDFRYNLMLNKASSLSYYDFELDKLKARQAEADESYRLKLQAHKHAREVVISRLALLETELSEVNRQLGDKTMTPAGKARLEYRLALVNLEKDSLLLQEKSFMPDQVADRMLKTQRDKMRQAAVESFGYNAIFMQWLSIGGGLKNNSFKQFDATETTLTDQIIRRNFTTWNLSAEWNIYSWHHYSRYTWYLQIGAAFDVGDNFGELTKTELTDTYQYGAGSTSRTSTRKFTAYTGNYETRIIGGKFYLDYYKFLWNNNTAFHIYPGMVLQKERKTMYNAGLGFLYSFMNAREKSDLPRLHAEFYLEFSDLADNLSTGLTFIKRSEFGLRFAFPIAFL